MAKLAASGLGPLCGQKRDLKAPNTALPGSLLISISKKHWGRSCTPMAAPRPRHLDTKQRRSPRGPSLRPSLLTQGFNYSGAAPPQPRPRRRGKLALRGSGSCREHASQARRRQRGPSPPSSRVPPLPMAPFSPGFTWRLQRFVPSQRAPLSPRCPPAPPPGGAATPGRHYPPGPNGRARPRPLPALPAALSRPLREGQGGGDVRGGMMDSPVPRLKKKK